MLAWESDGDEDLAVLNQIKTYIQMWHSHLTFVILLGSIDINVRN